MTDNSVIYGGIIGNNAKWIQATNIFGDFKTYAPYFRKSFIISNKVKKAQISICGVGHYLLFINGVRVGNEVLNQPFTVYDKKLYYTTHDITEYLKSGENVVGVILGNGMYRPQQPNVWNHHNSTWIDTNKLIADIRIATENDEINVVSDKTWKTSTGAFIFNDLYCGDVYDNRLDPQGWSSEGFDDSSWMNVAVTRGVGGKLQEMKHHPVRVTKNVEAISIMKINENYLVDFGEIFSGWVQIKLKNMNKGTEITLKYGEVLSKDGELDTHHISQYVESSEFQTDKYICSGDEVEEWEPTFTYHGFRYMLVKGYTGELSKDNIVGRLIHAAFEKTGEFSCSNERLNRISLCAKNSSLANFVLIPTDCPHREKNGWTGDVVISAEQFLLNYNCVSDLIKWLDDICDSQRPNGQIPGIAPIGCNWAWGWSCGPAWDSIIIELPWMIYMYTGDVSILSEYYDNMQRYFDSLQKTTIDYIVNLGLDDWCPPRYPENGGLATSKCPVALSSTAIFYDCAVKLTKISTILNDFSSVDKYKNTSEKIKAKFIAEFINIENGYVAGNCQTSYALVLYYKLIEGGMAEKVFAHLVDEVEKTDRHIDCGIFGAKAVPRMLCEYDRPDLAYAIVNNLTYPGWGYWVEQGATTLYETWSGDASLCHHMFADVEAYFYRYVAGIRYNENDPGFQKVLLQPMPVFGINYAKAKIATRKGDIIIEWESIEDQLTIKAEIPDGCTGELALPRNSFNNFVTNLTGNIKIIN
ncbi:MAG: hypothetical protein A2Y17_05900 [Clostridiales bacterium GWF2_38_85]|nr:MAG: hypothetical protein A2Y17_05900 [Clostridiales bacterium GWF2_38_85]